MTTVKDIMSYGLLTVNADEKLRDVIGRMRRIGHEGSPVVEDGRVIGLLTARDMNRAAENELDHLTVRDVMVAGEVFVTPDTPLRNLLSVMVDSDWGQIPVVEDGNLVGIVTRTDVIAHYDRVENRLTTARTVSHEEVRTVLGDGPAALIGFIANQAREQHYIIYMVGGVVRDLLLKRPNLDIDFVIEGDAIAFANSLVNNYGGRIETHTAFGTAKWIFDEGAAQHIGYSLDELPVYVDLVTARHEFYEESAMLPTVYTSGIKLDLRRRDFTINALAIRLSANGARGEVIDLFGGLRDLESRTIRVLHSLSFADDPTRALRAVRFSHRLHFKIEPRTESLIQTALPMIRRISGERLRNELTLTLKEPQPATALTRLQSMGVLSAIHPAFILNERLQEFFDHTANHPEWDESHMWLIVAACMQAEAISQITDRLQFNRPLAAAMHDIATLIVQPDRFLSGPTSKVTFRLDTLAPEALEVAAELVYRPEHRETIHTYLSTWRHIKPITSGQSLIDMGLKPGPIFRIILDALRTAWLDGEISSETEEIAYLHRHFESELTNGER